MRFAAVLLTIAVVLFVWAAAVVADWVSFGTPAFLETMGLACFAASFHPWAQRG